MTFLYLISESKTRASLSVYHCRLHIFALKALLSRQQAQLWLKYSLWAPLFCPQMWQLRVVQSSLSTYATVDVQIFPSAPAPQLHSIQHHHLCYFCTCADTTMYYFRLCPSNQTTRRRSQMPRRLEMQVSKNELLSAVQSSGAPSGSMLRHVTSQPASCARAHGWRHAKNEALTDW